MCVGEHHYGHYLDGDGYITRISFAKGKVEMMIMMVMMMIIIMTMMMFSSNRV
jgi:hypothetical protein